MIIGPAIKKLAKNVIPLALEGSQSLHENFDDSTNGSSILKEKLSDSRQNGSFGACEC